MNNLTIADVINTLAKYPLETPILLLTENSVANRISCQEAWINNQLDNICLIGWNNIDSSIINEIYSIEDEHILAQAKELEQSMY